MPPRDSLALRVRVALAEDGRKDFEIAAEANITPESLGSIKQGVTKNPPLDKLRSLAHALGKPTSYFTAPLGYVPIGQPGDALAAAEIAILADPKWDDDMKRKAIRALREGDASLSDDAEVRGRKA